MTSPAPDRLSLGPAAARNLATITRSVPQTTAISPRWLLRMLPWVAVPAATYRVNQRLSYRVGDGRVALNHPEFRLLHNADLRQRLYPGSGPPTPDDLDRLLARRRRSHMFLVHPRAIAAFGRECTRRGIRPGTVHVTGGRRVPAWRGVPLLPCDKIPVTATGTSSVLVIRTGEPHQGVIGLSPPDLPHTHPDEPGISVRPAGTDGKGIARYLVSAYYSVAVLVPDALGILEDVDLTEKP